MHAATAAPFGMVLGLRRGLCARRAHVDQSDASGRDDDGEESCDLAVGIRADAAGDAASCERDEQPDRRAAVAVDEIVCELGDLGAVAAAHLARICEQDPGDESGH